MIPTSRYTIDSKHQRHAMFDKAVDKLSSMCTVSSRLFGGSEDIITHTTPFLTFLERIDRSPLINNRDSEIVLDKMLQHYRHPTVKQLQESHRWIDDRHRTEEQKYDASKVYFIHCHDIAHTERIVREFELQHVVLIGTFERWFRDGVRDNHRIFAGFNNLRSVKFLLPWVTHIGNDWLRQCDALENPIFTGMSSLVEVGHYWLLDCDALLNPSFIGLSSLEKIGDAWMSRCRALRFRDYDGLSSLNQVGHGYAPRRTRYLYV